VGGIEQVFLGEFTHTIDDKGRLTLPAKFRPVLGQGVVITRGIDKCLFIFTLDEFQRIADKVSELPMTQADGREFSRHFFSGASDVEVDKQGRILIPQNLREYAELDGDVMVTGVNKRIEVWNVNAWHQVRESFERNAATDAEHWVKLGV
jgi:MraZ protein